MFSSLDSTFESISELRKDEAKLEALDPSLKNLFVRLPPAADLRMAELELAASSGALRMTKEDVKDCGPSLENSERPVYSASKKKSAKYSSTIRIRHDGSRSNISRPSVSKVLKATMPIDRQLLLKRWEERMVDSMGREAFDEMNRYRSDLGFNLFFCKLQTLAFSRDGIHQYF
jgi:hypothetical protein